MNNLLLNKHDSLDILEIYEEVIVSSKTDKLTVLRRSKRESRKIQILFKQHIPLLGKYYFEVELISYQPKYKC